MHLSQDESVSLISPMVSARAATSARWASSDAMRRGSVGCENLGARRGPKGQRGGWGADCEAVPQQVLSVMLSHSVPRRAAQRWQRRKVLGIATVPPLYIVLRAKRREKGFERQNGAPWSNEDGPYCHESGLICIKRAFHATGGSSWPWGSPSLSVPRGCG